MGIRWSQTSYYSSYEKAFDKVDQTEKVILVRKGQRSRRLKHVDGLLRNVFLGSVVLLVAVVAWLQQQPQQYYGFRQRLLYTGLSAALPASLWLARRLLSGVLHLLDRREDVLLKKLADSRKKMVQDLKDTRYEQIVALLKKYDPETQKQQQQLHEQQLQLEQRARQASSLAAGAGLRQRGHADRPGPQSKALALMPPAASITSEAGKLVGLLANRFIGDSPELVETLRRERAVLESLRQENERLKQQLAFARRRLEEGSDSGNGSTPEQARVDPAAEAVMLSKADSELSLQPMKGHMGQMQLMPAPPMVH